MAKQVGITGGIGSGKTTICKLFETLGIPVYYADYRAKKLMTDSKELVQQIKGLIGTESYFEDGSLNRPFIASVVFKDQTKLNQLNAIVHPAVHEDGRLWQAAQTSVYTLNEAALMVESGGYKRMDKLITVFAPQDMRIARVMQRDNSTEAEVLARINKQLPEIEKINKANFVINNDGSYSLIKQVYGVHQQLLKEFEG